MSTGLHGEMEWLNKFLSLAQGSSTLEIDGKENTTSEYHKVHTW